MGLEVVQFINGLVPTNPPGGDSKSQGDDHLRLIKTVLQNTLPNADRPFYFPTGVALTGDLSLTAAHDGAILSVSANAAARTLTLPATAGLPAGYRAVVVKNDASVNTVTVVPNSGTIQGEASIVLKDQWAYATLTWTGAEWVAQKFEAAPYYRLVGKTAGATLTRAEMKSLVSVNAATNVTIVLPTAVGYDGDWLYVKNLAADHTVVIDGHSTQTIDGAATLTLANQYDAVLLVANGGNWFVAAQEDNTPVIPLLGQATGIYSYAASQTITTGQRGATIELTGSTARTFTLPAVGSTAAGDLYYFKNRATDLLTLDGNASELIDNQTTLVLGPGCSVVLVSRGTYWDIWGARPPARVFLEDRKTSGTAGDTLGVGTTKKTFNSTLENTISGAAVAASVVTLPAGRYHARCMIPVNMNTNNGARTFRLQNTTDGTTLVMGRKWVNTNGFAHGMDFWLDGLFVLTAAKTIEVQYVSTQPDSQLATSSEEEYYGFLEIERLD